MASSSSSTTTNKLENNYFFYGTHPLKVPNNLVHANSTTNLTATLSPNQNSNYSSLNLTTSTTHHGFSSVTDLTTAKSLNNLTKSRTDDDDENNEVKKKETSYVFY